MDLKKERSSRLQIEITNTTSKISVYISLLYFILIWSNINLHLNFESAGLVLMFIINLVTLLLLSPEILKNDQFSLLVYCAATFFILIGSYISQTGIGSLIVFLNFITLVLLVKHIRIDQKTKKIVSLIIFIFWVFYNINYTTLSFNPNSIGYIFLLTMIFPVSILLKTSLNSLLGFTIFSITFFQILNTENRSSFIAMLVIIFIFCSFGYLSLNNRLVKNIIFSLLTLGSILFSYVYVKLWVNNVEFKIPFINKFLYSGREAIWYEIFELVPQYLFFGIGSDTVLKSFETLNIHNSMLNIFSVYGLPTIVFSTVLLYPIFNEATKLANLSYKNRFLYASLVSLFVVAFFETNLLWHNVNYMFFLIFIFLDRDFQ